AHQRLGDAERASEYYQESLKIRKEMDQREAQCTCLFNLGILSMEANEPEEALTYYNYALSIAMDTGAKPRVSQAHKHLSGAYEKTGDW
ncbi:MAG: tetratricopeptide repeat protein, partial [Aliifodinibius sp.]|nr:tetratricopeptide repeat protein [Fodinibius sp.]NIV10184.1 tetratricopeptide repeat protein [Fodinibius sp.]NIY23799.1 tetratricopeptide repeat protein [Fodinibius sp.]